jgi:predicted DNA-binding transcriptional regulator AlpA
VSDTPAVCPAPVPDPAPAAAPDAPPDHTDAGRSAPLTQVIEALLVPAPEAARLCGISEASWYRLKSASKLPLPVRLGGRVLWRVDELRAWIAAGCPDRREWEARRAVAGTANGRR